MIADAAAASEVRPCVDPTTILREPTMDHRLRLHSEATETSRVERRQSESATRGRGEWARSKIFKLAQRFRASFERTRGFDYLQLAIIEGC